MPCRRAERGSRRAAIPGWSTAPICQPADIQVSLERMRGIEAIDPVGRTMTVQAGCPVQAAQEAAEEQGLRFAVDWGGRGTATIGGGISTNAGGNSVVRYGMMRDNVLGMEAVLADGTVISSMNTLLKNNAAYDLKQLFIGSEGTLGIVTRAVLKLHPRAALDPDRAARAGKLRCGAGAVCRAGPAARQRPDRVRSDVGQLL